MILDVSFACKNAVIGLIPYVPAPHTLPTTVVPLKNVTEPPGTAGVSTLEIMAVSVTGVPKMIGSVAETLSATAGCCRSAW